MKCGAIFAGAMLLVCSGAALAANGMTTDAVHMYAGPGDNYPQVMRLGAGRPLTIHACLSTYEWCDVTWRGNRGWVSAYGLATLNQNVSLADGGAQLGVPQVRFNLRSYWEENYQQRPWYADRDEWYRLQDER